MAAGCCGLLKAFHLEYFLYINSILNASKRYSHFYLRGTSCTSILDTVERYSKKRQIFYIAAFETCSSLHELLVNFNPK